MVSFCPARSFAGGSTKLICALNPSFGKADGRPSFFGFGGSVVTTWLVLPPAHARLNAYGARAKIKIRFLIFILIISLSETVHSRVGKRLVYLDSQIQSG